MKRFTLSLLFFCLLYNITKAQICPTLAITSTSIACNGNSTGAATVTPTGGTLPYTYTWLPSGGNASVATNLSAGNYTIRVADGGTCVVTATVDILQPNLYVAVETHTNVTCYGSFGAASFTTIGGTSPSSFTWLPSGGNSANATNLSPGTYTVLIKDVNNCSLTQTLTITGPTFPLASTTTQTNNLCGATNGGATASVTGGVSPYTYTWSPTGGNAATATLVSGVYTVNIKDANNCVISNTVNILQSSSPTLTPISKNITCNGAANGAATVNIAGGSFPFTYTWSPSGGNAATATNLGPGTYTLALTDASTCTNYTTVTITQPAVLASTGTQTNILCNGGTGIASVAVTGGTSPYTYVWSPAGGSAASATLPVGAYTVAVTDASLCTTSSAFTLTQPAPLTSTGTQTNILCNAALTGAASVTVTGGVVPYTYSWSPSGGTASSATGLAAGNYTVVAKDNNSCTVSSSFTITQPNAIVTTMLSTSISCNGQSTGAATVNATGGVGPYTYTWQPSGGNTFTAGSLPANIYTVQVKDVNGCIKSPTVQISEPPALVATVSQTNLTCFGSNDGTASVSVTGGVAPYTYTWLPSGSTTTSLSALPTGNYSVTVEDFNHCLNQRTFTITSPPQYTITVTSASVGCYGQSTGSISVNVQGGTPGYTYTWQPVVSTGSAAYGLVTGDYTVNIHDTHNCPAVRTVSIAQSSPLAGVIGSSAANCGNPDGTASVTVSGGTGAYTYSWTPSGGTSSVATLGAGQYTSTITDANNCKLVLTTTVSAINPSVSLTSGSIIICSGSTTTISATGSSSYTWSPSASLSSSSGSLVTASPTISTIYTVTGANAYGCTVTNTIQIQLFVDPTPTITITDGKLCLGSVVTLSATGAFNFTWSPATGLSNTLSGTPTATLTGPVVYTVTVVNGPGCSGTETISLAPAPLPVVTISTSAASVCEGEGLTLTASGAGTYTWSNGSNANPLGFFPTANVNYTVTGTSAGGCDNTATVSVNVNPLPTVSISANPSACQGETVTLSASGASTYSWSDGGSGTSIAVTPSVSGVYSVTGTDANGCKGTKDFSLTVIETPTLNISGKQEACRSEMLTFNATGGTTYTWSTGEQAASINHSFTTNTVLTVSSAAGSCPPVSTSFSVAINAVPTATVSASLTQLNNGQSSQLMITSTDTQYLWTPSTGLSCNTCANPVAQPAATTIYTVDVTNKKGCKVSQTVTLTVDASCGDLFAPSAFSPNDDGNNDTWCVYGSCIETLHFEVYNRWGQKVFSSDDKSQCWDGKLNGVMQSPGVFIFQVQATLTNGESKSLKGNVTLIK